MNFWNEHGLLFLLFLFCFPRLTLFFSSIPFGGILGIIAWAFIPRLFAAFLITIKYFDSNQILCFVLWIWALSFEFGEKYIIVRRR